MVRLIQIWPGWVFAARSLISRPTSLEPVKAMKRVLGCCDDGVAEGGAGAGAEIHHAGRQSGLLQHFKKLGGDGRRVAGRLEDHGVAGHDGRRRHARP